MKRVINFILFSLCGSILFSCKFSQDRRLVIDKSNSFPNSGDTLLIIFNYEDSFSYKRIEVFQKKEFIHYGKNFKESPDLIVNIGHYPDQKSINLSSKELIKYSILYDSNTNFNTWANQSYNSYFLIEKNELFHSNSNSLKFFEVSFSAKGDI